MKKKKFILPEAEIVLCTMGDVLLASGGLNEDDEFYSDDPYDFD